VWPGKDKFLLVPKDDTGKPIWVEPDHPAAREVRLTDFEATHGEVDDDDPYRDNLLFTGDSLDVLRVLRDVPEFARHYRGKVKLVYIDPPFNTGQTFTHYDDWMEHSTWLSFMRDRLLLIKDLLAPGGSAWIHLDNFEVHRMRCLADEVFGAENFINTVVWKRTGAKSAARRGMGTLYDNILVYGRSLETRLNPVLAPYSDDYLKTKYNQVDARGTYRLGPLLAPGVRKGDSGMPWQGVDPTAKGQHWSAPQIPDVYGPDAATLTTRQKLDRLLDADYIVLPRKAGGTPQGKIYLNPNGGVAIGDFWSDIKVINSQGKERVGYDTQKPEALLQRVIAMASNEGDIVVDCFGGSGTTAATAHKLRRRWISVEVLPATVSGFTAPRLTKVIDGKDAGGITEAVGWNGGGGFRQVQVAPSMYQTTALGVMLADWATNGRFARAVAGQLGFEWQSKKHAPFCGIRGRMRLAVFDGAVGIEEAREVLAALGERERVTIVAKVVLPGVEEFVAEQSKGSRVKKAPRDLLTGRTRRERRQAEGTT
jgi:adenine-specific DNA-methyltransferase